MPTLLEMRKYVADEYPDSPGWHQKVSRMRSDQVIAIYKRFKNHKMTEKKKRLDAEAKANENYHQIDIWEYLTEQGIEKGLKGSHTNIDV